MADETEEDDKDENTDSSVKIRRREEVVEKNKWVLFEKDSEVPFLAQPPSRVDDMNSEKYIDRLERKLRRIKDPSKITSKNIVSALTEARKGQMSCFMNEGSGPRSNLSNLTSNDVNWDDNIRESKYCCVSCYGYLFPKQGKTTQEVQCLLEEDELAIVNLEQDSQVEDNLEDHQLMPG